MAEPKEVLVMLEIEPLKGGLLQALKDTLHQDEEAILVLNGTSGEALVVTDSRVIVLKAGYSSGAMFGRKAKSFPFDQISSVETSRAITAGRLQITAAGTVEIKQQSIGDAFQAENVVNYPTAKGMHEKFTRAATIIRGKMAAARQQQPAVTPGTFSLADELERLASLVTKGILSQAEFDAKKKQLLGL